MSKALIVVDVQRDFCEGGALAVEGGLAVADKIYQHVVDNAGEYDQFIFTKDWHEAPPSTNGGHFALPPSEPDFIDTWPVHCVKESPMSDFAPGAKRAFLRLYDAGRITRDNLFFKGTGRPDYSGFQGANENGVPLVEFLTERGVDEVDVVGIAGDYCVRHTALDALKNNFKVNVLADMVASVRGHEATLATVKEVADNGNAVQG